MSNQPILRVRNLSKFFPIKKGFLNKTVNHVRAVNDISFDILPRQTVGLVGESGCGKSTTGNCIIRLLDPTSGSLEWLRGDGSYADLARMTQHEMKQYRSNLQMVFQDPYSSLNPRMPVRDIIAEPLVAFRREHGTALDDQVSELMKKVGLRPEYRTRYPHAFSGGQRQRIGIARALALNPKLVICDEAVSSLDVSVQAQTLGLLEDLQEEYGMSYLFIAHDLSAVKHISDTVVVMYVGRIVEMGKAQDVYSNPQHPYTEALLASVPKLIADKTKRKPNLKGEVPDPSNPPSGCFFHPRCKYATEECQHCSQELLPAGTAVGAGHLSSCIHAGGLTLQGV